MKKELLIIGIVFIIFGIVLLFTGYQKIQPTQTEKTIGLLKDITEDLTGEKFGDFSHRVNTETIVILVLGGVLFLSGIVLIIKSGSKKSNGIQFQNTGLNNTMYTNNDKNHNLCPHCGARLISDSRFCSECGKKIES